MVYRQPLEQQQQQLLELRQEEVEEEEVWRIGSSCPYLSCLMKF
jgi:hypothetical protein